MPMEKADLTSCEDFNIRQMVARNGELVGVIYMQYHGKQIAFSFDAFQAIILTQAMAELTKDLLNGNLKEN